MGCFFFILGRFFKEIFKDKVRRGFSVLKLDII